MFGFNIEFSLSYIDSSLSKSPLLQQTTIATNCSHRIAPALLQFDDFSKITYVFALQTPSGFSLICVEESSRFCVLHVPFLAFCNS